MKLALGTVQFGLDYGINNQRGIPSENEVSSILKLAYENGIDTLDTAQSYGNAEERISKYLNNKFKIVTKFTNFDANVFTNSLNRLMLENVYGYMAHNADLLIQNPHWWKSLLLLKNQGVVKKIGYSLYDVGQLETLLLEGMIPDIVQLPYNILDRRFESSILDLSKMGVEIHTRSVFLQGLLHMNLNQVPLKLSLIKPYLQAIHNLSEIAKISIGELCLGFVKGNPSIDKIVIGVDSSSQLKENLFYYKSSNLSKEIVSQIINIEVDEIGLLNPTNWK